MSTTNLEIATKSEAIRRGRARRVTVPLWASWLLLALIAACAIGCQTVQVTADWDPAVDFTRLGSWHFAKIPQISTGNEVLDTNTLFTGRVERAIEQDLTSRGYVKRPDDAETDFEVAYFFTVQDKTKVTQINDYYGYGPGYGYGWNGGYGSSQTVVDQYQQGMLIIDISKPGEKRKLLWRGTGSARLNEKQESPENAQKKIDAAVTAILARFPPAAKAK